jgi:putative RecB family exonuclease
MELPEHTSASQLTTYASCPRKYELRYLEGAERESTAVGLMLGSAVHASLGWWHERRNHGAAPSVAEAVLVAEADMQASLDGPPVEWGRWSEGDFRAHTEAMVRFAIDTLGDMPVRASEVRFTLPLVDPTTGRTLPRALLGYYDFVLSDHRVVELKTSRAEYTDTTVRTSIQLAAYLTAMDVQHSASRLELEVVVKTKTPRLQRISLVPDARDQAVVLADRSSHRAGHRRGPLPALPGVRLCVLRVPPPVPGQRTGGLCRSRLTTSWSAA